MPTLTWCLQLQLTRYQEIDYSFWYKIETIASQSIIFQIAFQFNFGFAELTVE